MTACNLVGGYQRFREACCHLHCTSPHMCCVPLQSHLNILFLNSNNTYSFVRVKQQVLLLCETTVELLLFVVQSIGIYKSIGKQNVLNWIASNVPRIYECPLLNAVLYFLLTFATFSKYCTVVHLCISFNEMLLCLQENIRPVFFLSLMHKVNVPRHVTDHYKSFFQCVVSPYRAIIRTSVRIMWDQWGKVMLASGCHAMCSW